MVFPDAAGTINKSFRKGREVLNCSMISFFPTIPRNRFAMEGAEDVPVVIPFICLANISPHTNLLFFRTVSRAWQMACRNVPLKPFLCSRHIEILFKHGFVGILGYSFTASPMRFFMSSLLNSKELLM